MEYQNSGPSGTLSARTMNCNVIFVPVIQKYNAQCNFLSALVVLRCHNAKSVIIIFFFYHQFI